MFGGGRSLKFRCALILCLGGGRGNNKIMEVDKVGFAANDGIYHGFMCRLRNDQIL